MQPEDEMQYLQALRRGDQQAVEILVNEYYPALLNFLLHMGCQRCDAEDIIQETFIKAVKGIKHYQHRDRFRIWLFRICHNSLRDYYKKASRCREIPHDPATLLAAETSHPEGFMIKKEQALRVQAGLNQLSAKQRLVVVLRYYHDFSLKDTASVLRCPVGTVKSRLNTALVNLKSFIQEGDA